MQRNTSKTDDFVAETVSTPLEKAGTLQTKACPPGKMVSKESETLKLITQSTSGKYIMEERAIKNSLSFLNIKR